MVSTLEEKKLVDNPTSKSNGDDNNEDSGHKPFSLLLWANFIACIVFGPMNFVLYKVMYSAYGDSRAFFVSQGVNLIYVLYGGVILYYCTLKGEITDEMRKIPHSKFIIMGFLDSLGGFLAAMGANGTSGTLQQLLNQTLIPMTMILSFFILGRKSTLLQVFAAGLIFIGAWVVIVSSSNGPDSSNFSFLSNFVSIHFVFSSQCTCTCVLQNHYVLLFFRSISHPTFQLGCLWYTRS